MTAPRDTEIEAAPEAGMCPRCGHGMHLHAPLNLDPPTYFVCGYYHRAERRSCSCRLNTLLPWADPSPEDESTRTASDHPAPEQPATEAGRLERIAKDNQRKCAWAACSQVSRKDVEWLIEREAARPSVALEPLLPNHAIDADLLREVATSFGVKVKKDVWTWIAVAYRRQASLPVECMRHEQCTHNGDHYSACPAYEGG